MEVSRRARRCMEECRPMVSCLVEVARPWWKLWMKIVVELLVQVLGCRRLLVEVLVLVVEVSGLMSLKTMVVELCAEMVLVSVVVGAC